MWWLAHAVNGALGAGQSSVRVVSAGRAAVFTLDASEPTWQKETPRIPLSNQVQIRTRPGLQMARDVLDRARGRGPEEAILTAHFRNSPCPWSLNGRPRQPERESFPYRFVAGPPDLGLRLGHQQALELPGDPHADLPMELLFDLDRIGPGSGWLCLSGVRLAEPTEVPVGLQFLASAHALRLDASASQLVTGGPDYEYFLDNLRRARRQAVQAYSATAAEDARARSFLLAELNVLASSTRRHEDERLMRHLESCPLLDMADGQIWSIRDAREKAVYLTPEGLREPLPGMLARGHGDPEPCMRVLGVPFFPNHPDLPRLLGARARREAWLATSPSPPELEGTHLQCRFRGESWNGMVGLFPSLLHGPGRLTLWLAGRRFANRHCLSPGLAAVVELTDFRFDRFCEWVVEEDEGYRAMLGSLMAAATGLVRGLGRTGYNRLAVSLLAEARALERPDLVQELQGLSSFRQLQGEPLAADCLPAHGPIHYLCLLPDRVELIPPLPVPVLVVDGEELESLQALAADRLTPADRDPELARLLTLAKFLQRPLYQAEEGFRCRQESADGCWLLPQSGGLPRLELRLLHRERLVATRVLPFAVGPVIGEMRLPPEVQALPSWTDVREDAAWEAFQDLVLASLEEFEDSSLTPALHEGQPWALDYFWRALPTRLRGDLETSPAHVARLLELPLWKDLSGSAWTLAQLRASGVLDYVTVGLEQPPGFEGRVLLLAGSALAITQELLPGTPLRDRTLTFQTLARPDRGEQFVSFAHEWQLHVPWDQQRGCQILWMRDNVLVREARPSLPIAFQAILSEDWSIERVWDGVCARLCSTLRRRTSPPPPREVSLWLRWALDAERLSPTLSEAIWRAPLVQGWLQPLNLQTLQERMEHSSRLAGIRAPFWARMRQQLPDGLRAQLAGGLPHPNLPVLSPEVEQALGVDVEWMDERLEEGLAQLRADRLRQLGGSGAALCHRDEDVCVLAELCCDRDVPSQVWADDWDAPRPLDLPPNFLMVGWWGETHLSLPASGVLARTAEQVLDQTADHPEWLVPLLHLMLDRRTRRWVGARVAGAVVVRWGSGGKGSLVRLAERMESPSPISLAAQAVHSDCLQLEPEGPLARRLLATWPDRFQVYQPIALVRPQREPTAVWTDELLQDTGCPPPQRWDIPGGALLDRGMVNGAHPLFRRVVSDRRLYRLLLAAAVQADPAQRRELHLRLLVDLASDDCP